MPTWMPVFLLLLSGAAPADSSPGPATFFVLRHAEKLDTGPDPGLSPEGRDRARHLARMLSEAGVSRILSTDYRRTRETVEPLASRLGLEIGLYDPRDLDGLVESLRGFDGRCVIVGHSNTTPEVVSRLGGEAGPPIDDATEFDRLYVLHTGPDGATSSAILRYGPR